MADRERFIDRTGWPRGPWDRESDRREWRRKSLPCLIVRSELGNLCGYVGVPPGHPWHGSHHITDVGVHGGLTFHSLCQEGGRVCHIPRPGEPANVWWIGFDCAHAGDCLPSTLAILSPLGIGLGVYRDMAYVRDEVNSLADQVARRGRETVELPLGGED